MKQQEIIYPDSLKELGKTIQKNFPKTKEILLITGSSSLQKSAAEPVVKEQLKNFRVVQLTTVGKNPDSKDLKNFIEPIKEKSIDLIKNAKPLRSSSWAKLHCGLSHE